MNIVVRIIIPALLFFVMASCNAGDKDTQTDGDQDLSEADFEFSDGDGETSDYSETDGDEEDLIGEAIDLLPYVNLYASRTLADVLPWPRESTDVVATLRDDNPETSWKAPGDGDSYLDMDIMPWLGRTVNLDSLALELNPLDEGNAPAVTVLLYNACGGHMLREFPLPDLSATLDLKGWSAGCVRLQFTPSEESAFEVKSLHLISRDASITLPDSRPEAQQIKHARYGVIEGFYGVPWSWAERRQMLDTLAAQGMGAYLYCPKDDDLHRARWREAYSEEFMAEFAALNDYATQRGQTLYFGLSPFIDYNFDEADFAVLKDKVGAFVEMGVKGIAILGDDIEFDIQDEVDGELGAQHVVVLNRLLTELRENAPDLQMLFVPTVYSDERADEWPAGLDYLETLNDLEESIGIMWTGPGTSNEFLQAADLERFTDTVGRAPLIWDNYYANDGGDGFTGRVLLAPFDGRAADLPQAVDGIMHNPMIQGGLARLALGGFGYWVDNPQASGLQYDKAKIAQSVENELPYGFGAAFDDERTGQALELFMQTWNGHAQRFPAFARLDELVAVLKQGVEAGTVEPDDAGVRELLGIFAQLSITESLIYHSGLSRDITDEMYWPACSMRHVGEQGLFTLQALGARLSDNEAASEFITAARAAQQEAGRCRFQFERDAVDILTEAVEKMTAKNADFSAPEFAEDNAACNVGEVWQSTPMENGAQNIAYGLPGATEAEGRIIFNAPYAGNFAYVRLGIGDKGWNIKSGLLLCDTQ